MSDNTKRVLIYIKYIVICGVMFTLFSLFLPEVVACVISAWVTFEMIHDPSNTEEHRVLKLTEIHIFPRIK